MMGQEQAIGPAEPAEPRRQVGHFLLLVLVGLTVMASLILSARPPTLANFTNVATGRVVPAAVLREIGPADWSVVIQRRDWRPEVAALLTPVQDAPPRLAWIVSEWSFLGLPLAAFRRSEVAAVEADGYGYRLTGLSDAQRDTVARAGGPGPFPFWRYCWGWLAVAAVAGFAWAELRWQARRREMLA